MKNYFYAALAALLTAGCASHEGYTLTGEVPEAWEGKPVVLFTTDAGQACAVDSTKVSNGKFRLSGTFGTPRGCRVAIYLDPENRQDRNFVVSFPVFLDSTAVSAVCDASHQEPVWKISGGATQAQSDAYQAELGALSEDYGKAFKEYAKAFYYGDDLQKSIDLARAVTEKSRARTEFTARYIAEHPGSVVSLVALQELCDRYTSLSGERLNALFAGLSPQLRESGAGRYTGQCVRGKRILPGSPIPDIELQDPGMKTRRLSEYIRPGHVTLIELWASWCNPCRADIPFVKKAYDMYHKKGFEIVSVSVDRSADRWKEAVEEEKMPWTQLLDHTGRCFQTFETTAVPTAILVDGEGRISLLNARGGWLFGALQEAYDK